MMEWNPLISNNVTAFDKFHIIVTYYGELKLLFPIQDKDKETIG